MRNTLKYLFIITIASSFLYGCAGETNTSNKNQTSVNKIENVSATRAYEIINANKDNSEFNILDIRTPQEYQSGHIANSINLDYYATDFESKIDSIDKGKTYLIYCRSGNRSGRAVTLMKQKGFSRVYNMAKGINDWQNNKLPLIK